MKFDFDYWKDLYQSDPVEFDRQRMACLEQMARSIQPDERRVHQLMARINGQDMRLNRIKNPISRQVALEKMLYTQLSAFATALQKLTNL